jgi:hypothetical protein
MNLVQIAERLKGMPLQAVMAYANGMNPEVPPYVALSEMSRRNRISQSGAQGEMPADEGTVKDQVEEEAVTGGMPQAQQPMQQAQPQIPPQALQQLMAMVAQGQRQGQPQPQGQPRPAPNPMGGIAANPVPQKMFSAAGGGIVAFSEGDEVEDEEGLDTEAEAAELLRMGKERLGRTPSAPTSPLAQREALLKKHPHLAILDKPIGQEAIAGLKALQAKQAEEDAREQEALKDQRKMDFYKALIASGEASRGQRGIGAVFGGFGKSMAGSEEALRRRETEIRGRGLKRESDMLTLRNEMEKLQRARAEGDVQGEIKHSQAVAEMANKLGVSQNALLRGMFQGITSLRGRERAAEATEEAAKSRASGRGGAGPKVTDFQRKVDTLAADYERQGMSPEDARAKATREVIASGPGVTSTQERVDQERKQLAAKEAARAAVPFYGKPEYDKKYDEAYERALARLRQGQNQGLGSLPPGGAPTGAPAPGAPKLPPGFVPVK